MRQVSPAKLSRSRWRLAHADEQSPKSGNDLSRSSDHQQGLRLAFVGSPLTIHRRGLTLTELLIAIVLLAMLAAGSASLTRAGRMASAQSRQWDRQAQTGRGALQRIRATVASAFGSNDFPGAVVFPTLHSGGYVPDTLVVWLPLAGATPQSPQGQPMTNELVFFFPDPGNRRRLIESRVTDFPMPAPLLSDTAGWTSLLTTAKTDDFNTEWVELNRHLRIARVAPSVSRAVVHFHLTYAPTDAAFADYTAALVAWEDLPWPLGRVSAATGYRRAVCQVELQLQIPDAPPFYVTGSATASFPVQP